MAKAKAKKKWACKSSFPCGDCLNPCDLWMRKRTERAVGGALQILADRASKMCGGIAVAELKCMGVTLARREGRLKGG